jgi:hypothetical protein
MTTKHNTSHAGGPIEVLICLVFAISIFLTGLFTGIGLTENETQMDLFLQGLELYREPTQGEWNIRPIIPNESLHQ